MVLFIYHHLCKSPENTTLRNIHGNQKVVLSLSVLQRQNIWIIKKWNGFPISIDMKSISESKSHWMWVAYMHLIFLNCMSVHVCLWTIGVCGVLRNQKTVSDSLPLELQTTVSQHMDAENQILQKSSQCLEPLRHLFSPAYMHLKLLIKLHPRTKNWCSCSLFISVLSFVVLCKVTSEWNIFTSIFWQI